MSKSVSDNLTITSVQARKAILKAFQAKRPVFLWGPPGIGKSEVVQEIADELKGFVIDLRMAQMEPTDIRGIPFFNKDLGKMDWAAPVDLPDEDFASQYPIVVLFLDEMNSAPPAVQAAGYQLILNRRVGKYVLPDNVVIVAAGNRDSDKGVTYRMPMPLANRFLHLEMRPDFTAWQNWAVSKGIHKDVVGYLSFAKQDLYEFDSKSSSRAFATPRSWYSLVTCSRTRMLTMTPCSTWLQAQLAKVSQSSSWHTVRLQARCLNPAIFSLVRSRILQSRKSRRCTP